MSTPVEKKINGKTKKKKRTKIKQRDSFTRLKIAPIEVLGCK
jgi:hypothetical protein